MDKEKFYTVAQVAEILGVTPHTIYAEHRRGKIPFIKIGRLNRITETQLLEYLERAAK